MSNEDLAVAAVRLQPMLEKAEQQITKLVGYCQQIEHKLERSRNLENATFKAWENSSLELDVLKRAVKRLLRVPAVGMVLGNEHVAKCECPKCVLEALVK